MANQPIYTKGKDIFVYLNGVAVGCDKNCKIEFTTKTFDVTSKCTVDANGNLQSSVIPIMVTAKISGSGFTVLDSGASGAHEQSTGNMINLLINQTKVYATWTAGGRLYGFDCYITTLTESANFDEVSTYDYEISQTGPITEMPVS